MQYLVDVNDSEMVPIWHEPLAEFEITLSTFPRTSLSYLYFSLSLL